MSEGRQDIQSYHLFIAGIGDVNLKHPLVRDTVSEQQVTKGLLMQYLCDCSSLSCSVICKELIQSTSGYKYKQRYTDICPGTVQQPIQSFCPHITKFNASNPYSRILLNITGEI